MRTRSMLTWVAACALIFLSTQAFAIDAEFSRLNYGNFKLGKFTLIPGLSVQEAYDDNIYLASGFNTAAFPAEKIVHDWLTYVKPAFGAEYEITGRGKIELGYQGTLTYYNSETDNNWQNHQGLFKIDYEAPSGWIFKLNNDYNHKEDPYGDANSFGIGDTAKRWKNKLGGQFGFRFGETLKSLLYYNYEKQVYDKQITRPFDFTQDYQAYEGGIGLAGKVMPKTWAFVRYFYKQFDYDTSSSQAASAGITDSNDADYNRNRFNVGMNWDSDAKLSGELNLGWAWYNFKNELDPFGARYQDENTWVAFTSVNFRPSEMTELGLNLNRDLQSTGSQSKEFFIETQIGAKVSQTFVEKLKVYAGLSYAYQDYNTKDREDRNIQANAGLDYLIMKWLSCGFEYIHMQKESTSTAVADQQGSLNEYSDNRYLFKITAAY